ncbi:hypothetical protein SB6422_04170 [Klebsiella huaxiensis]|uniref:Uncharacterized protein n=1 Tax=Klebsiella huaxiensis TaxID=2153354 RepID=A0A564HHC3_9ENTR|nr:hypothetical protein SB6422_04170 [Klebsiella huaxiensis]
MVILGIVIGQMAVSVLIARSPGDVDADLPFPGAAQSALPGLQVRAV